LALSALPQSGAPGGGVKRCSKCKRRKPLAEFHADAGKADGRSSRCKPCARLITKAWRAAHVERHRAANRAYRRTATGRVAVSASNERYRKAHPEKTRARWRVQRALRDGRLQRRPCETCGAPRAHAHHDDYGRPLAVRWLCRVHHAEAHR
jgi:hypothetical protein